MKCVEGIWFPDSEVHLCEQLALVGHYIEGKGTYQYSKLIAAMPYVREKRCAIDVGMHVGLWAMHLVKQFERVVGFEPVKEHIECLRMNMEGADNYQVYNCALGNKICTTSPQFLTGSTGSTTLVHKGDGTDYIPVMSLDDFTFEHVDFIKVDVEGYEKFVIEGAEKTIRRHKPVLIVEQKGTKGVPGRGGKYDAVRLLKAWGASRAFAEHGDYCMVFEA